MEITEHDQRVPHTATGEIPSVLQPQTAVPDSTHFPEHFNSPTAITARPASSAAVQGQGHGQGLPAPPAGSFQEFPSVPLTLTKKGKLPSTSRTGRQSRNTSPTAAASFGTARPKEEEEAAMVDQEEGTPVLVMAETAEVKDQPNLVEQPEQPEQPEAGPSTAPAKRIYPKRPKKKIEKLLQYTTAFVPGLINIKNPAGDFLQKEANVDVIRQTSLARAKREKEEIEAERTRRAQAGEEVPPLQPLSHTLIIHPGSRNLRIGRASDFYPKEIPFCIARPSHAANRGKDPPVPGSRAKRIARTAREKRERKRQKLSENGDTRSNGDDGQDQLDEDGVDDPVEKHIDDLRDYLRNRLRSNRLSTDYRDGLRVKQFNAKVRPEPIPEHNDPYRIDWTEVNGKKYFVGTEAIRLPADSGFSVRYPLLHRGLNLRDWGSPQLLMDDIATILHESLKTELNISPKDYKKYSVVLLVPDHGDRLYLQALVNLLFGEFGFKELAIHQESPAAIFSAGMSTACVVDIGATTTTVGFVDEGLLNPDTRIKLDYGGDDITAALVELLTRSNFPYKELDLGRAMDWAMMDKFKEKIATLEEHMVANIAWDLHVLKEQGLTQKYQLRTYDENILAPLCFFDTRMIDFKEELGAGRIAFWEESEDVDDELSTGYDEPTGAMRACTTHLLPARPDPTPAAVPEIPEAGLPVAPDPYTANQPVVQLDGMEKAPNGTSKPGLHPPSSTNGSPAPPEVANSEIAASTRTSPIPVTMAPPVPAPAEIPVSAYDGIDIVGEAARSPLDAAIAAAISMAGTENKIKAAAGSILLIGGGSALKGLSPFIAERLPPLLRAKGLPISDVSIVPPPRGLNPRFVSWKGASVMCNLESLSDMWIRRDEWEALGARTLKDRLLFL